VLAIGYVISRSFRPAGFWASAAELWLSAPNSFVFVVEQKDVAMNRQELSPHWRICERRWQQWVQINHSRDSRTPIGKTADGAFGDLSYH
jgi:hypothetical protein